MRATASDGQKRYFWHHDWHHAVHWANVSDERAHLMHVQVAVLADYA